MSLTLVFALSRRLWASLFFLHCSQRTIMGATRFAMYLAADHEHHTCVKFLLADDEGWRLAEEAILFCIAWRSYSTRQCCTQRQTTSRARITLLEEIERWFIGISRALSQRSTGRSAHVYMCPHAPGHAFVHGKGTTSVARSPNPVCHRKVLFARISGALLAQCPCSNGVRVAKLSEGAAGRITCPGEGWWSLPR